MKKVADMTPAEFQDLCRRLVERISDEDIPEDMTFLFQFFGPEIRGKGKPRGYYRGCHNCGSQTPRDVKRHIEITTKVLGGMS